MAKTPKSDSPQTSFQDLILRLERFWADQGCVILQPYDMEVGAGTFHPATTLRSLGPKPWRAAYVQPSRRPKDGRYGENPNRLQHYYQFQVIMKPSPADIQDLYLQSLDAIGIDPKSTTSASSRTTGRARRSAPGGLAGRCGATAWRWRSSLISSRSAASTAIPSPARSPTGSSAWPCMCRASTASSISTSMAARARQAHLRRRVPAGRAGIFALQLRACRHRALLASFPRRRGGVQGSACQRRPGRAPSDGAARLRSGIKASHIFNLLDARGVISVIERQAYILRVRELTKACCAAWLKTETGPSAC